MPCVDENLAVDFVGGQLTDEAARAIERHMDECPDCLVRIVAFARAQQSSADGSAVEASLSLDRHPGEGLRRGEHVGRYVVLSLVGAGAMGSVYSALDPVLRRTIALKLVRATSEDLARQTDRLVREARMLAQVAHPNVIAVHDVGTYEGRVFLAMDFVDGQTLRDWLTAPRRAQEILATFVEAGRGLAAAHAAGVVHRDFKPENVLVGNDGRVLVTDFGLARDARAADAASSDFVTTERRGSLEETLGAGIVGTPAYMATEQLEGASADHLSDQYSFCVALYEALYGRRPARGLARIETSTAPDDATRGRSASGRVRRAILRGLSEASTRRHSSMSALLAALTHDPWKRARRIGPVVAVGACAAALLGLRVRETYRHRETCRAESSLAQVWDAPRKNQIRTAFLATNKPYAEDAWRKVESGLASYASDVAAATERACETIPLGGARSVQQAAQTACLRERFEELRAVSDVLASADEDIVRNASSLPRQLAPIGLCSTDHALQAPPQPDDAIAPSVARLRAALARGHALREAGKVRDAMAIVQPAADASMTLGFLPLEASALYELGYLQSLTGQQARADETMARVVRLADGARADGVRLRALSQRIYLNAIILKRAERIAELDAEAASTLLRMHGEDPRSEASYRYGLAQALRSLGDIERASENGARAVELYERAYGAASPEAGRALAGLCLVAYERGDMPGAIGHCERARATLGETLGHAHPDFGWASMNLGVMYVAAGQLDAGCRHAEEGYRVGKAALGFEQLQVVYAASNLGDCLTERGEPSRAIALLEAALAGSERVEGSSDVDVARALMRLGKAYVEAGLVERALPLLERSLAAGDRHQAHADDRAETSFVLARALGTSGSDPRRARRLAENALRILAEQSPMMTRHHQLRSRIEAFVAERR